ncbi:MAG: hypothetical protein AAGH60_13655 [Pseudomonadota bacterium]
MQDSYSNAPPPSSSEAGETAANNAEIAPVPRISMQAFCESPDLLDAVQQAAQDRRMAKAHVKAHPGGIAAAIEFFTSAPTPNLLILENKASAEQLLGSLQQLADVCDPGTDVVVIGHVNDVILYRELIRQGVRDYVVAPLSPMDVVALVSDIYAASRETKLGRTYAFIGARGGVGSSTVPTMSLGRLPTRFKFPRYLLILTCLSAQPISTLTRIRRLGSGMWSMRQIGSMRRSLIACLPSVPNG